MFSVVALSLIVRANSLNAVDDALNYYFFIHFRLEISKWLVSGIISDIALVTAGLYNNRGNPSPRILWTQDASV